MGQVSVALTSRLLQSHLFAYQIRRLAIGDRSNHLLARIMGLVFLALAIYAFASVNYSALAIAAADVGQSG